MSTAAVTMGMLTVAGAFAPAALAAPDPVDAPGNRASEQESTPAPEVLTPAPRVAATTVAVTTTPTGAHYGTGKHSISLESSDAYVPEGEVIDATGAQVQMTFSKLNDVEQVVESTCTFGPFIVGTACIFPPGGDFPTGMLGDVDVPAGSEFTLELVKQPDSGQLLVLTGSPSPVLHGYTSSAGGTVDPDEVLGSSSFVLSAPGGYRTLGVAVAGTGDRSGATFELCTIADGDCAEAPEPVDPPVDPLLGDASLGGMDPATVVTATTDAKGTATFDGIYRPGTYRVVQTAAPAGATFDDAPRELVVAAATKLADRDVPVTLPVPALGGDTGGETTPPTTTPPTTSPAPTTPPVTTTPAPTTPPVSTPPTPTKPPVTTSPAPTTPPVSTPPVTTPPVSTPPVTTPAPTTPPVSAPPVDAPAPVAAPEIAAGEEQTITLSGFQPFEMVHGVLHSTPVDLGTVQADADGNATFTFTVPAGLETGAHSVTMTGLTSGAEAEVGFTVTAAETVTSDDGAGDTGGLAYTGTDVAPLLALGGGLLVAGAGTVLVTRRRRSS